MPTPSTCPPPRFFFFNDTATTEIYTLSLHDALPISDSGYSNGHTRDNQGRLIALEHDTRRVRRREYDGTWTVLVDRKSTRLNSSHSQISYAVFCLKKKKKNHISVSFITAQLSISRDV